VIDVYTPASSHWSVAAYMAMVLPAILLLCSIRHLKYLAPFSLLANLLYVVGLIITFQFLVVNMVPTASLPAFNSWASLPLFFGTVRVPKGLSTIIITCYNKLACILTQQLLFR